MQLFSFLCKKNHYPDIYIVMGRSSSWQYPILHGPKAPLRECSKDETSWSRVQNKCATSQYAGRISEIVERFGHSAGLATGTLVESTLFLVPGKENAFEVTRGCKASLVLCEKASMRVVPCFRNNRAKSCHLYPSAISNGVRSHFSFASTSASFSISIWANSTALKKADMCNGVLSKLSRRFTSAP